MSERMPLSRSQKRLLALAGIALFASAIIFAAQTKTASAQCASGTGGFVPLECFEQSRKLQGAYTESELGPFIQKVFVGAIAIGAMLAVLRLAWAGFVYMGTDMWGKKEHAKEVLTDTLIGLFLLLAIYLILYQINPDILKLNINVSPPASQNFNVGTTPF
jgi:hypothetical protein